MRKKMLRSILIIAGLGIGGLYAFAPGSAVAANPATINFQGKVVNSNGTNETSGTVSRTFIFRLYQNVNISTYNPNATTCALDANCVWEETDTLNVTDGIFQVPLGAVCPLFTSNACNKSAPLNFNTLNSLSLTMKYNSDAAGFMTPLVSLQSVPYAYNSDNLGGIAASGFLQLAPNSVQTDSSNNVSIFVNKGAASGNILQLQKNTANVLIVDNSGLITLQPAASLTSGQTALTQTLTNASSSGGTVNGYSQAVTVSNTSSTSTTNGIMITFSDATSLANNDVGISVDLTGITNSSASKTAAIFSGGSISQTNNGVSYIGGADAGGLTNSGTVGNTTYQSLVSGRTLFTLSDTSTACSQTAGTSGCQLKSFDISNPAAPQYLGGAIVTGATNSGTSSAKGYLTGDRSGNYLYLGQTTANGTACSQTPGSAIGCEIQIFDVSNPKSPTYVGGMDVSGLSNGTSSGSPIQVIKVYGKYLLVGLNTGSATACSQTPGSAIGCEFQVYDISNPTRPRYIGGADASGTANGGTGNNNINSITTYGHYALIGTGGNTTACSQTPGSAIGCELQVYDMSNPAVPSYVSGVDSDGSATGITNSSALYGAATFSHYLYSIKSSSGTCSTGAGNGSGCDLQIYDISNPAAPVYQGGLDTTGLNNSAVSSTSFEDIIIAGRYAYFATTGSANSCSSTAGSADGCEIQMYDISNPILPAYKGGADASGLSNAGSGNVNFWSLSISGSILFTTSSALIPACSQTAGSSIGCELKAFNSSGIDSVSLTTGSLSAGTSLIQGNQGVGGNLNVMGGINIGQGVQVAGTISTSTSLLISSAGNTGSVTVSLDSTTTNYSLALPASGATGTQCLQSTSGSTSTATTLTFGSCGAGGGTFATTYSTTSQSSNTIAYSNSGGGALIIQNAATPLTTVLSVDTASSTFHYLQLNLASSVPHLQVFGASSTNYADIYYDAGTSTAYFKASTGTTQVGNAAGGAINIASGSGNAITITGGANSTYTTSAGYIRLDGPSGIQFGTSGSANGLISFINLTNSNLIGITAPSGASAPGASYNLTLPSSAGSPNQCLQNSGTAGILTFSACGSGSGTSLSVDGVAVGSTGNLQDTTGTTSVAATNFTNTSGNITLTVAAATTGVAGIVTATGTQNFDGNKVFTGTVQVQAAGGLTVGTSSTAGTLALFNGTNTVSIQGASSTTAYTITLPSSAAAAANRCLTSTGANGTLQWLPCGAGNTATVTLSPEFEGAVMTADGGTNTGTMTSDFCSGSTRQNLNTGVCTVTTESHNYYDWTSTGSNDYDIFVRWQVPSDFASFSSGSFYGWKTASGDGVTMNVYNNAAATCAAQATSATTGSWQSNPITMTGCTPTAGTVITIDIHLAVAASGNHARIGEITLTYNRN
jgi:hypothetical protein